MFLIVLLHFITRTVFPEIGQTGYTWDIHSICILPLWAISYLAVNSFILISGFYGIRFKWKSLLSLYLTCGFCGFIGYLIYLLNGGTIGGGILWYTFFPFSHGKWWFINCYVGLYCLSPLLNNAFTNLSHKQFKQVLILLTILNIYLGYF